MLLVILEVVHESRADTDWGVGYIDGNPALEDHMGNWYIVPNGHAFLNPYDSHVWYAKDGEWEWYPATNWQTKTSRSCVVTASGPAIITPEIFYVDGRKTDGGGWGESSDRRLEQLYGIGDGESDRIRLGRLIVIGLEEAIRCAVELSKNFKSPAFEVLNHKLERILVANRRHRIL